MLDTTELRARLAQLNREGKIQWRDGAIGKAVLIWFFSGSLGLAILAYFVLVGMGC